MSRGSATTRSASSGPSSSSQTAPSATSRRERAGAHATPAAASRRATSSLAAPPNTPSGASSRVTTSTSRSRPRRAAPCAVSSASSYSGSVQPTPDGATKTTRRAAGPRAASARRASSTASTSRGPAKVSAPGTTGSGRAPTRKQERVVAARPAVARLHPPLSRAHARDDVGDPAHAAVAGDRLPLVPHGRLGAERLGDRERAVGEERPAVSTAISARPPARSCSARSASSAPTPPPATSTRNGGAVIAAHPPRSPAARRARSRRSRASTARRRRAAPCIRDTTVGKRSSYGHCRPRHGHPQAWGAARRCGGLRRREVGQDRADGRPAPDEEPSSSVPPISAARSRMPARPKPSVGAAASKPCPSSATTTSSASVARVIRTSTRCARACARRW